jgi:hypothetical protein
MPGHSRSKNGVASLAYVPGIHVFRSCSKAWMAGTNPAMTEKIVRGQLTALFRLSTRSVFSHEKPPSASGARPKWP